MWKPQEMEKIQIRGLGLGVACGQDLKGKGPFSAIVGMRGTIGPWIVRTISSGPLPIF